MFVKIINYYWNNSVWQNKKNVYNSFLAKGREILLNTKHLIENMKYEIIYGDTDSIMIKTNLLEYNEVISIGNKVILYKYT